MVASHADAFAGMKLGAALAHDDVARDDDLAAEFLDAEPPSGAVATVAGRTARLFMCHFPISYGAASSCPASRIPVICSTV